MLFETYKSVVKGFDPDLTARIEAGLTDLAKISDPGQIKQNVMTENGLDSTTFKDLLRLFGDNLEKTSASDAWELACRAHKLKGPLVPKAKVPQTLGRVKTVATHAAHVAALPPTLRAGLTASTAKEALYKYAGAAVPNYLEIVLRAAPLGKFVVWATFNDKDNFSDPFASLPSQHCDICTVLGLGMIGSGEPLIKLVWGHAASGSPPLYQPTVADAGEYSYFRPKAEDKQYWGLTEPLAPNATGFSGQPEVVMQETSSIGIQLPFFIVA